MISNVKSQYKDISIEDVKAVDEFKDLTDEKAEEIKQDIISLCDVMAAIIIEQNKMNDNGNKKSNKQSHK